MKSAVVLSNCIIFYAKSSHLNFKNAKQF